MLEPCDVLLFDSAVGYKVSAARGTHGGGDSDKGNAMQHFRGRFNIQTFIVAPGVAAAPLVFNNPPLPDAAQNPATGPVQTYHLGLWFNSPTDAQNAGCPNTVTPFNGEHNAGIQVLNTSNYPDNSGPLRNLIP
jgi:hypothetical protein